MEFDEVVRRRRMVRSFHAAPVPIAALRRALRRAVRAPSAGFAQGWDVVVLTADADREAFWAAATPPSDSAPDRWLRGVRRAPCLVLVCSDPQAYVERYARPDKVARRPGPQAQDWPIPYWDVDAGMGALLLLLSGVDDGLGGLFFGVPGPRHDAVRAALGVPADRRLVGVVALGYPAEPEKGEGSPGASSEAGDGPLTPGDSAATAPRRHRPPRRPITDVVHDGRFGTGASWVLDRSAQQPADTPDTLSLFETEPWLRDREPGDPTGRDADS